MKTYLQNIKYYIISLLFYRYWIRVRRKSKDEDGELCYCGHTPKCDCADPDKYLFAESVCRGTIKLFDKNNGWKNQKS